MPRDGYDRGTTHIIRGISYHFSMITLLCGDAYSKTRFNARLQGDLRLRYHHDLTPNGRVSENQS